MWTFNKETPWLQAISTTSRQQQQQPTKFFPHVCGRSVHPQQFPVACLVPTLGHIHFRYVFHFSPHRRGRSSNTWSRLNETHFSAGSRQMNAATTSNSPKSSWSAALPTANWNIGFKFDRLVIIVKRCLHLLASILPEGYRYSEDIQLVAVVLSTHRKKMKLHAYELTFSEDFQRQIF